MCVFCVAGYRSVECVRIMRWWSSNFVQWTLQNLGSVDYSHIAILEPPCFSSRRLIYFRGGDLPPSLSSPPPTSVFYLYRIIHLPGRHLSPSHHTNTPVPLPDPSLSVTSPSSPPSLPPHLPDSRLRHSLAAAKISYNLDLICFLSAACLRHGSWRFPLPS